MTNAIPQTDAQRHVRYLASVIGTLVLLRKWLNLCKPYAWPYLDNQEKAAWNALAEALDFILTLLPLPAQSSGGPPF